MTTTTSYGTWVTRVDQYALNLETTVLKALGSYGGDDYDIEAINIAYHHAINAALPDGVSLAGDEFIGPAYAADHDFDGYPTDDDGNLDIGTIVEGVELWPIIEQHELWTLEQIGVDVLKSKAKDPAKAASRTIFRLGLKPAGYRPHPDSGRPQAYFKARKVEAALAARSGKGARTDLRTMILVSATVGDIVPGHEIGSPDCPDVPGLLDRKDVNTFMAKNGYDADHPDEVMYLVVDEDQFEEIPDGFPTLTVHI